MVVGAGWGAAGTLEGMQHPGPGLGAPAAGGPRAARGEGKKGYRWVWGMSSQVQDCHKLSQEPSTPAPAAAPPACPPACPAASEDLSEGITDRDTDTLWRDIEEENLNLLRASAGTAMEPSNN